MKILVAGATGYIGGRLVPRLLEAGHSVRCLARDSGRLAGRYSGAEIFEADVLDENGLEHAFSGIECAFYLIHSMYSSRNFLDADEKAARNFANAASASGVKRIVYLGGLGSDDERLSAHLRSRHEVGDVLRSSGIPVTEFRAAMIIGSGSVSFEMMRYLTERLPIMIAPRWVVTRCQPIAIGDVLAYLIGTLGSADTAGRIYEIGGADIMTYRDMMLRYAAIRNLKRKLIVVPFFTPLLSSYWVHLITPISADIARPLILGLHNEVVVRDRSAARDFPDVRPLSFDAAVLRALDRYLMTEPETTWFDAFNSHKSPSRHGGITEGMLIDKRERLCRATPRQLETVFSRLGGRRGWLYGDSLWRLRGLIDRAVGGIGLRSGRRSSSELRIGDAVDFWRVEAYEPDRLLRLRAEMKLPGKAWLQFEAEPAPHNRSILRQTAFFEPRGLFGHLYWYSVAVFHRFIFANMASQIVREAEKAVKAKH